MKKLVFFLFFALLFAFSAMGSSQVAVAKKAAKVATKQAEIAQKVVNRATKKAAEKVAEARKAAVNAAKKPNSKKTRQKEKIAIAVAQITLEQAKVAQKASDEATKQARIARKAIVEAIRQTAKDKASERVAKAAAKQVEKYARWQAQQERLKRRLNLSCPDGGWEDVIIEKELVGDAFRVSGNRFARFILARYMGLVLVINRYDETVDIDEGGRAMVSNMCPHGKITLLAVLSWDAGIIDLGGRYSDYEEFVWTATRFVNGHQYYGVSRKMSLYVYQWQKEKKAQWVMEVEDIDRSFPEHRSRR